jgi:hypothetical protein
MCLGNVGVQAIYPAAGWRAGAHANLRLACARGVGLRLSTPPILNLIVQGILWPFGSHKKDAKDQGSMATDNDSDGSISEHQIRV